MDRKPTCCLANERGVSFATMTTPKGSLLLELLLLLLLPLSDPLEDSRTISLVAA
jgi:hypothetical protein